MSTRAAKTRPVDPLWPVLMAAEGLCVVAEADGSWRAVYGVTVPEGSLPFPVPRVIGHCGCPLGAAVVAMERTVLALREGWSGVCLSAGSVGAGSPEPRKAEEKSPPPREDAGLPPQARGEIEEGAV